ENTPAPGELSEDAEGRVKIFYARAEAPLRCVRHEALLRKARLDTTGSTLRYTLCRRGPVAFHVGKAGKEAEL
ncbi:MAG: hypothetical protein WCA32_11985, partial [Chromatiaceae bacterium]